MAIGDDFVKCPACGGNKLVCYIRATHPYHVLENDDGDVYFNIDIFNDMIDDEIQEIYCDNCNKSWPSEESFVADRKAKIEQLAKVN